MTKRVRDILLDIGSGDVRLSSEGSRSLNFYEVIWGSLFGDDGNTLYANIYIPSYNVGSMKADSAGRFTLNFHTAYQPSATSFRIRLVTKVDGEYQKIDQSSCAFPVVSDACLPGGDQLTINASELMFINMEGYYVAELVFGNGGNMSFIYSAGNVDFGIGVSDEQSAQLLSLCAPGKYYRYPLTGVDITRYINTVVGHTDFSRRISDEFEKDGIDADNIGFDSSIGKIDVVFRHEESVKVPETLVDPINLGLEDVDVTDDFISAIATDVDLDDLDVNYNFLDPGDDVPSVRLESCFANGVWIGAFPWTEAELWKGQE